MKTKEELNILKDEVESLNKKLEELTQEELEQVFGGTHCGIYAGQGVMVNPPVMDGLLIESEINPASTGGWFGTGDMGRSSLSGGQQQRIIIGRDDLKYQLTGGAFRYKNKS